MIDKMAWVEGYHEDQDLRRCGPEARPGNMEQMAEAIDELGTSLTNSQKEIKELQGKVEILEQSRRMRENNGK